MNHPTAAKSVGSPRSTDAVPQTVASAVGGLREAIQSNDTPGMISGTRKLITSLAERTSEITGFKAELCSILTRCDPALPLVLASSHQGRAVFFRTTRQVINELAARTSEAAGDPFGPTPAVSSEIETSAINGILHHLATHESGRQTRLVRLTAVEILNHRHMNPITSMLLALGEARDPEIRAQAVRLLLNHLSFPLSEGAKVELQAIHANAGALLGVLCKKVDTSCGKPSWMMHIPELIKQWQLACSAAHVDSGINLDDLALCSVNNRGPLQDWEIRCATSPSDPLTLVFFQAKLRAVVSR